MPAETTTTTEDAKSAKESRRIRDDKIISRLFALIIVGWFSLGMVRLDGKLRSLHFHSETRNQGTKMLERFQSNRSEFDCDDLLFRDGDPIMMPVVKSGVSWDAREAKRAF